MLIVSKRHPAATPASNSSLEDKVDAILGDQLESAGAHLAIMMRCRSCNKRYEWGGSINDLEDFDEYYNLCGGSDRCIP